MPPWFQPWIGVSVYLGVLIAIGLRASRRMQNLQDYFVGGKTMGFWAVAFSARATGESAWLLLGLTGMAAVIGLHALWIVVGELAGLAISWIWMSRPFKRLTDLYDAMTVPDFFEARFEDGSHRLRLVCALALIVFVTIYVSAQIDATGAAFETFLGWNYVFGVLLGFGVVVAYIVSGGFVAVVWSDIFQGTLMVVGLVVLPVTGLIAAGGPLMVWRDLEATSPALLQLGPADPGVVGWAETAGLCLIGLGFLGSPQLFVRFMALRSEHQLRAGTVVAIVWTLLADLGAVAIGLVGRHLLIGPSGDVASLGRGGQDVLPQLVAATMPGWIAGFYVAIVLAAIMSTIDSLLVLAASAVVRDLRLALGAPALSDAALIRQSRIVTVGLAALALALALVVAATTPTRTIFWFVIFGWSGITATFCPATVLALAWSGFTARGATAAMLTGLVSVPLFKFWAPTWPAPWGPTFAALSELPPAFALSIASGIAFSALDPARAERRAAFQRDRIASASAGGPSGPKSTSSVTSLSVEGVAKTTSGAEQRDWRR